MREHRRLGKKKKNREQETGTEGQGDAGRHRETLRDTERHRETQRDIERDRETQRDTESQIHTET